ncbi:hypothetical protein [Nostoc sp.]|uniref:hypothetical protein n=1 Tax=Nostoc sp. TaxID=1180 RepID=UPI002FF1044F
MLTKIRFCQSLHHRQLTNPLSISKAFHSNFRGRGNQRCRWHNRLLVRDRLPLVSYFNPDCALLLSLSYSKVTLILEPSGFSQTNVAIVAERLTSTPRYKIDRTSVKDIPGLVNSPAALIHHKQIHGLGHHPEAFVF